MASVAALYLAHLNPLTNAHQQIISNLRQKYTVYVFPVRFFNNGKEVNTRSFPFSYDVRKQMVEAIFGNSVSVLPDYTFYAPYAKYLPPLLSLKSWKLRGQILREVREKHFVSYTGDKAERAMLKLYRLNPLNAERLEISATLVKESMYAEALTANKGGSWRKMVPSMVVEIIEKNWSSIQTFASAEDTTTRILGMKFPKDGYK